MPVHPTTCDALPLREDIPATLQGLAQVLRDGGHAACLRQQHQHRGSAEGMVDAAIAAFRGPDRAAGDVDPAGAGPSWR